MKGMTALRREVRCGCLVRVSGYCSSHAMAGSVSGGIQHLVSIGTSIPRPVGTKIVIVDCFSTQNIIK